jgi:hypothetical protein
VQDPSVRLLALPAAAALLACASAQRAGPDRCEAAFERVDALLRAGLAGYVDGMKRFAAARDPDRTTGGPEARASAAADAWTAAHRAPVVEACRGWSEETRRCVLAAAAASDLGACGVAPLVQSFTDEVVAAYAAAPLDR